MGEHRLEIKVENGKVDHYNRPKKQACMWGIIQREFRVCRGLRFVSTASHGGWLVSQKFAEKHLPAEVVAKGTVYGNYVCFEEDCNAALVEYFLADTGLLDEYFSQWLGTDRESAVRSAQTIISRWHPNVLSKELNTEEVRNSIF
jgi:hypothetical protein